MDVNAIDLAGAESELVADLERAAAENLKRVLRPPTDREPDWLAEPDLTRLLFPLETKTVWHPVGT
jgi:hypothetical protein